MKIPNAIPFHPQGHAARLLGLLIALLLAFLPRASAIEDPPGCSRARGGAGGISQGGLNFEQAQAHVGDTVPVFPSLGMASNACRAINATGAVYIATGLLTNFLVESARIICRRTCGRPAECYSRGMAITMNVVIEKDQDGDYAYCPESPGCKTQGDTFEIMVNIREAAERYLETLLAEERQGLTQKQIVTTALEVSVA